MESQRKRRLALAEQQQKVAQLEAVVPILTDEEGVPQQVVSQEDLELVLGQKLPTKGRPWRMAVRESALRIDDLQDKRVEDIALRDGMQLQIDANREALRLVDPALALLATGLQEAKAIQQAEQVKLAANTLADQAQDAWLALVDAEGKETKALAAQTKAEAAATKLALAATDAKNTAQQLQLDALTLAQQATEAKATAAQTGSASALAAANTAQSKADAAQTKADAADTKAVVAQTKADAAQVKAEAAQTAATSATSKADAAQSTANTAITNAAAASTQATAAQTTATAAQNDLNTFKGLFRRGVAATPAITVQLANPTTVDVSFTPSFADNNYRVVISKTSAGLLPLDISAVAKTASSFTLTLRNTGLASLAVPAGTVDYIIMHA